jgi:glucose dehydrogenase
VAPHNFADSLEWYYQAFPDDFHDWDLQISPVLTVVAGRSMVLGTGKGGYVFALDPASGGLLWKTAVGNHNGHDQDDELALEANSNCRRRTSSTRERPVGSRPTLRWRMALPTFLS